MQKHNITAEAQRFIMRFNDKLNQVNSEGRGGCNASARRSPNACAVRRTSGVFNALALPVQRSLSFVRDSYIFGQTSNLTNPIARLKKLQTACIDGGTHTT